MATINTTGTFYREGANPIGKTIGYESGPARPSVARYQFTSPSSGATSLSWVSSDASLTNYYYNDGYGSYWSTAWYFNFVITTDANAYKTYIGDAGNEVSPDLDNHHFSGSKTMNLMPNTTYYLFVFPNSSYSNQYAIWNIGDVVITTSGAYGASSITATNANIGSVSTITITRNSSSFTHTLQYKIDGQSSYTNIATNTSTTSFSWTVPDAAYTYMASNATTVGITFKCITYNGSTNIGEKTTTINAYAVESACKPTISISHTFLNNSAPYTGNGNIAILNWSNVEVTISATPKNGATIVSYALIHNGQTTNSDTATYNRIQTGIINYRATDSRGYISEGYLTLQTVAYFRPTITFSTVSPDATTGEAQVNASGTVYTGSFGLVNNALTVQYRYKEEGGSYGSWVNMTATGSDNTFTTTTSTLILDYTKKYYFQTRVVDTLNSITSSEAVVITIPLFDWGESDFHFNIPITLASNSYGSSLPQSGREGQVFFVI